MRTIGNIIWLVFGGLIAWLGWMICGLLWCLTVVGIPFGVQCFKIAGFVVWPFKKQVDIGNFGAGGFVANIIWICLFGWELAVGHVITACIFYITIVGIPFGNQHIKFAQLALVPFGAKIHSK